MTSKLSNRSLFVWRGKTSVYYWESDPSERFNFETSIYSLYRNHDTQCPFCGQVYLPSLHKSWGNGRSVDCHACGFSWFHGHVSAEDDPGYDAIWVDFATLTERGLNDEDLRLDELGAHLRRQFADVYQIDGHRFERLVGDIAKSSGFGVQYRQKSHDGGIDLVLQDATGGRIIVQCKLQPSGNPITVDVVRALLGVALLEQLREGPLPTLRLYALPRATRDAHKVAKEANLYARHSIVTIVEAEQFLKELEVYDAALPPLDMALRKLREFGAAVPVDWTKHL